MGSNGAFGGLTGAAGAMGTASMFEASVMRNFSYFQVPPETDFDFLGSYRGG